MPFIQTVIGGYERVSLTYKICFNVLSLLLFHVACSTRNTGTSEHG